MRTPIPSDLGAEPPSFFRRHWRGLVVGIFGLGLVVASPVLFLFGSVAVDAVNERWHRVAFDAAAWRAGLAASGETNPIRLRMVDDLLRRHRLVGLTHGELIALLGTPPDTAYFREYQVVYWLGPERGFMSIDSEWLAVRFGPDDRVAEARVVRD